MSDNKPFRGRYVTFKDFKSGVRLLIEIDHSEFKRWTALVGSPQIGEKFVALVPLDLSEAKVDEQEKLRQEWAELTRTQKAGILCGKPQFKEFAGHVLVWLGEPLPAIDDVGVQFIYRCCKVHSRKDLDATEYSRNQFDILDRAFYIWSTSTVSAVEAYERAAAEFVSQGQAGD